MVAVGGDTNEYIEHETALYMAKNGMVEPMTMEMAKLHFPQLPEQLLSKRVYGYNPNGSLNEYNYEDIPVKMIPNIYVEGDLN
jgi:hypothetical protein